MRFSLQELEITFNLTWVLGLKFTPDQESSVVRETANRRYSFDLKSLNSEKPQNENFLK